MGIHLKNNFEANNQKWEYVPNNGEGWSNFDGDPIPSRKVIELIGEEGVQKIDSILKGIKKAKEIIFGDVSKNTKLSDQQFFIATEDKTELDDIQEAFKNRIVIICDGSIKDSDFKQRTIGKVYGGGKRKWAKGAKIEGIERLHDYAILLPEDYKTSKSGINYANTYSFYGDIKRGRNNAIEKIKGTEEK